MNAGNATTSEIPLVLDFDGSAKTLPATQVLDMSAWQDAIRFACSSRLFKLLRDWLDQNMPQRHGPVLLGSGDFHHVSAILIERLGRQRQGQPFQVVVLDNHPDNMRFPFGIHCGSWVSRVARLPCVSHVYVIGISSTDVGVRHAWENRLLPLYAGKLSYWCMDVDVGWSRRIGLSRAFHRFDSPDELTASFIAAQHRRPYPTYLSIDKDVLSPETVRTNWDQGRMQERHLVDMIVAMKGSLIGCDITGELSQWCYRSCWKRWLSALDGQNTAVRSAQFDVWQQEQHHLNERLLKVLNASLVEMRDEKQTIDCLRRTMGC